MAASPVTVAAAAPSGAERRRRRHASPLLVFSLAFLALFVIMAVFGGWIAPYGAGQQNLLLGISGPASGHWFGTDDLGRDILSRVIVGSRTALVGPGLVALGSTLIGAPLGLVSGYLGGWTDAVVMRWVDLMYALPGLLVLIVIAGVVGASYSVAIVLLVVFMAPYTTRIVRGATLEQRPLAYVEAARTLGLSRRRIMFVHIGPNVLPETVATTCLQYALALLTLSSLSFLGLGVQPGSADWGLMAAENRTLVFQNAASALAPAAAIVLAAASTNIVGDWLFERLTARGRTR